MATIVIRLLIVFLEDFDAIDNEKKVGFILLLKKYARNIGKSLSISTFQLRHFFQKVIILNFGVYLWNDLQNDVHHQNA